MSKQTPSREQLDMATHHNGGDVEYGLYFELYTGPLEDGGVPDVTREEDWLGLIYPEQSLGHTVELAKEKWTAWAYYRNVHVVQRKVSPWEVKEND